MASTPPQIPGTAIPITNANVLSQMNSFTQPWWMFIITLFNRTGGSQGGTVVVSGSVMDWAGETIPDGYLLCDGSAVSRTVYAQLFTAIGTAWGAGDGSKTFNLPDFRGRFLIGADGSTYNVGDTGGATDVTLTTDNLPAHNHVIDDPGHTHVVDDPGHTHTLHDPGHHHTALTATSLNTAGTAAGTSTAGNTGNATTGITMDSATTGVTNETATTGVTTENTGGGDQFSIIPPFAVVQRIIKT